MLLTLATVLIAGCAHQASHTFLGVVTTMSPRLCLGRQAATGDCFVASGEITSRLVIGQCVEVTYRPIAGDGPRGEAMAARVIENAPRWCHL